jgi:hypothetical protein
VSAASFSITAVKPKFVQKYFFGLWVVQRSIKDNIHPESDLAQAHGDSGAFRDGETRLPPWNEG